MAKPRGGDWLADEMTDLRSAGVDILVCALTSEELHELDLVREADAAVSAGLEFHHLPIADMGLPDLGEATPVLDYLVRQLRSGKHIVTHCRFGIGRSSTLAAGLLVLAGENLDTVWANVERARQLPVPDTPEQRNWPAALRRA